MLKRGFLGNKFFPPGKLGRYERVLYGWEHQGGVSTLGGVGKGVSNYREVFGAKKRVSKNKGGEKSREIAD